MKKPISIIAIVLVFLSLASFTFANDVTKSNILDLSGYSVEELLQIRDEVDKELFNKGGFVIVEEGIYVVGKDIGAGTYIIKPYPKEENDYSDIIYSIYKNAEAKEELATQFTAYNSAWDNANEVKKSGGTPTWPERVNESQYRIDHGYIHAYKGESVRVSLEDGQVLTLYRNVGSPYITIQKVNGLFMD